MILYSASFKPKGFGIKKYVKIYKKDVAVVSDKKFSKRKRQKLEKYIISMNGDKLLNNSHLDICSYGCFKESDVISQLCETLFTKNSNLSLNDVNGYAAEILKKHIMKFSYVKVYGNRIYKDIQEQLYQTNGVCIIIANEKINNAIDTDKILDTAKNTAYSDNGVAVSYLDMLKYYGTKWQGTDKFISMIS